MTNMSVISPETASLSNLGLARDMLAQVLGQIHNTDEKVKGLFSANTLLAAALALSGQIIPRLSTAGSWDSLAAIKLLAAMAMIISIVTAALSAILALLPRVGRYQKHSSLFYFRDVAALDEEQFIQEVNSLSDQDIVCQLLEQVHVNSVILCQKVKWARRSAAGIIIALVMWLLVEVIALI